MGRTYLRHQHSEGRDFVTREHVPVTLGFQPLICRECRGLTPEAHPVAEIYGRTSKISRYYWRELAFRESELLGEWAATNGIDIEKAGPALLMERETVAKQALADIKELHSRSPKYTFTEESQSDVIAKCGVRVLDLKATYRVSQAGEKAQIVDGNESLSVEEFACRHFARQGYQWVSAESIPFHVLFGTFMWMVIGDLDDPRVQVRGFGERSAFEEGRRGEDILAHLPEDFGSEGYATRRAKALERHFSESIGDEDLHDLFEYWLPVSYRLRQYLWAHRDSDIARARTVLDVLPRDVIIRILRYLVGDYWDRYCGWPDLLLFKDGEYFFAEIKSSGDKLSEDQKQWIRGNFEFLKVPFVLVKVHKAATAP
jgi:hypothetical protein